MTTNKETYELDQITCLYEITKMLASSTDLRECLRQTVKILADRSKMKNGTITIHNPVTGQLEVEVAYGLTAEARKRGKYKIGEGITGRVVASGAPIIVPQISEDNRFLNRTRSRGDVNKSSLSFICVPIKHDGNTIGALSVYRQYKKGLDLDQDLQFLTILSGLVAQSVTRMQAVNEERKKLQHENTQLRMELSGKYKIESVISNSSRMQEVFEMMHRVADSNATVLLRGESGTGKTMIAKAIHYASKRTNKPFIVVNCSALPETLLESELFGHEQGAFTGAQSTKKGRFELAHGGTLFLDEIGELTQNVQIKLLNVIQDREFQRLGGTKTIKSDVRLITATNKDLENALKEGNFREDLYYRLNVFPVYIPPLRERKTDILLLAEHFLQKYTEENDKSIRRISTPAIDLLIQYHWPGNVRELQNCIERAVLICDEDSIKSYHLPPTLQSSETVSDHSPATFNAAVENFERELIVDALKKTNGNQTKAASLLDTSLRIINYKIGKYEIRPKQYKMSSN